MKKINQKRQTIAEELVMKEEEQSDGDQVTEKQSDEDVKSGKSREMSEIDEVSSEKESVQDYFIRRDSPSNLDNCEVLVPPGCYQEKSSDSSKKQLDIQMRKK